MSLKACVQDPHAPQGRNLTSPLLSHPLPCSYLCFVYTSFQERATKVSHGGTARIAKQCGNEPLAKLAGLIAADESRHEAAYTRTMDAIFKA